MMKGSEVMTIYIYLLQPMLLLFLLF